MQRTECAVCLSDKLASKIILNNYPIKFLGETDTTDLDKTIQHELVCCEDCNCLQLKNLVDPDILYNMAHNSSKSEVWLTHHKILANFIYDGLHHLTQKDIIEVGGSSGVIAEQLSLKDDVNYTIFDLCSENPNIKNVGFIVGNCETADFPADSSIVMSHVFEHLYEPNKFVKNMSRNNIQNIFISIPNMSLQLENKIHPVIYQEHTYLCEMEDIEYIFSKYGYSIQKTFYYGIHAILIHFRKTDTLIPVVRKRSVETINKIIRMYSEKATLASSFILETPYFIIPACFSGQLIYYNIDDKYKQNILGFLDNDKTKTGKRIYGTPHTIYSMEEIKKHPQKISIVIHRGAYINEIVSQLKSYKEDIEFNYV